MIVLINPNSTASMTEAMVQTAQQVSPDVAIEGWTSTDGPPAIQGKAQGDAAVPPMLELVDKAARNGARAIVIGCFDDTGLAEARRIASCPVVGIGQAAYHVAAMAGRRFSVVTTLEVSVPILEGNIRDYHLAPYLSRVRASGVEVLELERQPAAAADRVLGEILLAEQEDNIDCLVLGCAGMVHLPELIKKHTDLLLVDGVRAAIAVSRGFQQGAM